MEATEEAEETAEAVVEGGERSVLRYVYITHQS